MAKCEERIERRRAQLLGSRRPVPGAFDRGPPSTLRAFTRAASMSPLRCEGLQAVARQSPAGDFLELGSGVGLSGAYLAAVLEQRGQGKLLTVEGVPALADLASRTATLVGLAHRIEGVQATFDQALAVADQRYAFVLLDGEHRPEPTVRYVQRIVSLLLPSGLLLLDDCSEATGLSQTFEAIRSWIGCWSSSMTDGRFGVLRRSVDP